MAITLAEFEAKIDDEIAWRKKEVSVYDKTLEQSPADSSARSALIRAGVCLLYAHFEGATKAACTAYIEYIFQGRKKGKQLQTGLKAPYIISKLKQALNSGSAPDAIQLVSSLASIDEVRIDVKPGQVVRTESNLSYARLVDILYYLCIFDRVIEPKKNMIDVVILKNRNNIAHGKYLPVDYSSYEEVRGFIRWYLEWLSNTIKLRQLTNHGLVRHNLRSEADNSPQLDL